jgi:hypothetical protein
VRNHDAIPKVVLIMCRECSLPPVAIRIVLEGVMREELDALIGVGWGESSRQQRGLSQRLLQPRPGRDHGPH